MSIRRAMTAVLLPLILSTRVLHGQERGAAWMATFDQLRHVAPRPDLSAAVHGLTIRRAASTFRLELGRLFLLSDVAGRPAGVAFMGTGTFAFTPPTGVEQQRASRILGDSALAGTISAAVFVFADTTLAELRRRLSFEPGPDDPDVRSRVNEARDFLIDGSARQVDTELMAALLDSTQNGYFAAYLKRERGENLLIRIDPSQVENVQLLRRGRQIKQRTELVCQFEAERSNDTAFASAGDARDPLRVEQYRISARIADNYDFSASTTLLLMARRATGRWTLLSLFDELTVDSVLDEGGRPLEYFRSGRNEELWVRSSSTTAVGGTREVRVVYHGPLIEHGSLLREFMPSGLRGAGRVLPPMGDNWAFIRSTWDWFPRYGNVVATSMDMTFRTPRRYQFASIGRLADSATSGDTLVTHWVTEAPTRLSTFTIGQFELREVRDERIPPVTVLYNEEAHRFLREVFPDSRYSLDNVAADVANSLAFFTTTFGPPLFSHYYAAEFPYSHGEAYPGLMHLSWWTFLDWSGSGAEEIFRAHEMAHQWWGIGVEPATYRDRWMSEGFADFSGLWYMQVALHDNDRYFQQLQRSREEVFRERDRSAPIALGWRATESRTGAYELMIYKKGAWVLHMLRNLMLDAHTMSDTRFGDMMRDFYTRYRGRSASTRDFQRVVEEHIGQPMGWFFDEWVNGNAVPSYTFSWRDSVRADSTHFVRFRVRQEGVPATFAMYVPVLVHFVDNREVMVRILVRGASVEGQFTAPIAPASLTLNPLESVLGEVKTEDWH